MGINYFNPMEDMYRAKSINDLLIESMKGERHDRVKYGKMMEMTDDPMVKKQIKFAYDDEGKHYKMFNQIYQQLNGRKINIPIPTNIEKYNTLMDAVQSSIEGEFDAVELYRELFALLKNQQMRDKVFEIITDEQEHASRFIYLYSMLK
jgi:rubrerythrin